MGFHLRFAPSPQGRLHLASSSRRPGAAAGATATAVEQRDRREEDAEPSSPWSIPPRPSSTRYKTLNRSPRPTEAPRPGPCRPPRWSLSESRPHLTGAAAPRCATSSGRVRPNRSQERVALASFLLPHPWVLLHAPFHLITGFCSRLNISLLGT